MTVHVADGECNLTELEQKAIDSEINLSDGHPRQSLTENQQAIIESLPNLFKEATVEPFERLERDCVRAFFEAIGQRRAPIERVLSVYSASVATVAVALALADRSQKVALLHPTFDNIPDLLRRHVPIVAIPDTLEPGHIVPAAAQAGATCVFLTTPNNPTGRYFDEDMLQKVATDAAAAGVTLCLDTSFRGFEPRAQFDHYAILRNAGVDYMVIEDTGKLWPVAEMKLGFIATSPGWDAVVRHAVSDILLTVSPVVLLLVRELARDSSREGFASLHRLVSDNRATLLEAVTRLDDVELLDPDSAISVARVRFGDPVTAERVRLALRDRGVQVLPCGPFHWDRQEDGAAVLRVALSRDRELMARACRRLTDVGRSQKQAAP